MKDVAVEADDAGDVVVFGEMIVEVAQVIDDVDVLRGDEDAGGEGVIGDGTVVGGGLAGEEVFVVGLLAHRINVEADGIPEEAAEGFENAALEVLVVFLVKNFEEVVDALLCVVL